MAVKIGDNVKIEYTGRLDDGSIFDKSNGNPLIFQVGKGQVIPGFEKAIIGMEVGEEKDFKIESEDAYGDYDPEGIQQLPRSKIPNEELQPGMMIVLMTQDNRQIAAWIKEVSDDELTIDLNHPLAGKNLNFKIKLLEIGCELPTHDGCGCGEHHHH